MARRNGWGGGDSHASQDYANLQIEQVGERVPRFAAENEAEWRDSANADEGDPTDPGSAGLASPVALTNPLNTDVLGSMADFWMGAETAFGSGGETAPASAPAGLGGGDPASGPSVGPNAQSTHPIPTATGAQPGAADPLAGPATTGLLPGALTAFGTGATMGTPLDTHGAASLLGPDPLTRPSSQGPRIRPNSGGGGGGSLIISVANLSAQEGAALSNVTVATFTESPMDALSHYSATIQWGDGNNSSGTISSGNGFDYVKGGHTYAEERSYTVTVTVSDTDGSHASGNGTAGVSDAPLSGSANNVDATEGTAFSGTVASFTDADPQGAAGDYTATISWGDGTPSSTGTLGTNNGAFDVSGSHTYLEEGSFAISVTVGDSGGSTVVLTSTATVDDAPLSGSGLDITATAGSPAEVFLATFNDTDPNGTLGDYSAQVDWGDGTNSPGIVIDIGTEYAVFGSHTYATQGSYAVTVDTMDHGSSVTTSSTATVAGMAALGTDLNAVEGEDTGTVTVATFTDADGSGASSFTALIDWGDGSTPTNGTVTGSGSFAVTGNHTYADAGTYSVTVTIQDTDGADATTEGTATVADAALSSTGTTVTATEGTPLNDVPLAAFTDANTADASFDYTVDIYWGDGTPDSTGTVTGSDGSFVAGGTHTYADPGTYAVSIIILDEGGNSTCAVTTVTVNEAPLSGTGKSVTVDQGASTAGLTLATFTDGNPTDDPSDYTVSIDWGDGSGEDSGTVTGSDGTYNVSGDHAYAAEGTYSVTITIADEGSPDTGDDGPTITVTSTVTVPDAPLSGENGPGVTTEGLSTSTVTLGSFTDADPDADISYYTATIHWGDGQTSAGTISTADGITYVVTGSHTYADVTGSPYTATTTVDDEGGSSTTFTAPVTLQLADLDGKSAIAGAGWANEAQDDSPGILVGNSTANGAQLWVHATGLSGYTRTLAWDASRVTIYDGGTALTGSSVQLGESDGDKIYTVVATSGFGLSDTTVASLTVNAPGGGTESSDTVTMLRLADGQDVSAVEGASTGTVAVAAFTDPNAGDPASDYTTTINWGDGSPIDTGTVTGGSGSFVVDGSHTYTEEGSYTITVAITGPGASATATSTATVADAALSGTGANFNATVGALDSVTLGTFTDAGGPEDPANYFASIDWGDGDGADIGSISLSGTTFTVTGAHNYANAGSYSVRVTVMDDGGQTVTLSGNATVSDASLSITGLGGTAIEGAAATLTLATVTDANSADQASDFTVLIDWGDGTSADGSGSISGSGGSFSVSGTHSYDEEGTYTVTTTVFLGDTTVSATGAVTVADASLNAQAAPALETNESASTGTVLVATFSDDDPNGTLSDYSASIAWGDGQTSPGTIVADGFNNYDVFGSHTYTNLSPSSFSAQVTIQDAGGATATATTAISLNLADLDGRDALPGATWASEAQDDNPGIQVDGGGTTYEAEIWAHATGISGYTRTLTWDPTQLTLLDATPPLMNGQPGPPLTSGSLTLTESMGDRFYEVIGTPAFLLGSSSLITLTVTDNDNQPKGADQVKAVGGGLNVQLVSLGFSGGGQITLKKTGAASFNYNTQTFASDGDTIIKNPVWISDGAGGTKLNDPVAYVMGSTPTLTVKVKITGKAPAPVQFQIKGESSDFSTTVASFTSAGDQTLSETVALTQALANEVQRFDLFFDWQVSIGGAGFASIGNTKTTMMVTYAAPSGSAVTAKRLYWATNQARTRATPLTIVDSVAPATTAHSLFYLLATFQNTPWKVLDGQKADCITLASLTDVAVKILGVSGGAKHWIYARHASWNKMDRTSDVDDNFEKGPGGAELQFENGGLNRWEGTFYFKDPVTGTEQWWGGGSGVAKSDPWQVLTMWTRPNNNAAFNHQCWDTDEKSVVSYPSPPNVARMKVSAAVQKIQEAGPYKVSFRYEYAVDYPPGTVMGQSLGPGDYDDPYTTGIWLAVSLGPRH